jgi:hypothetical protein
MLYQISTEAQDDLFEIWQRIALDSVDLANRIEGESMPSSNLWRACRGKAIPATI